MIEILSLPRRPNFTAVQIKNVSFKSGLPINSLPGWEHIPLNSKLPMLKCPGNQVIFSKNKIGQSFRHLKQEFDPSGRDSFPEYNPLHDSNLKTFYANERNLKRLRENGEITQNNDVICNLKDFNEYRQQLHKTQLYYILQELNRLEAEQRDRMLINNAEQITNRDHRNLSARKHSHTEILSRKKYHDNQRALRFQRLLQRTEEKFQRIASMVEMQKVLMDHRKLLNNMKIQQHWDACNDLQRKHLISLKKLFQFKKERLQRNLRIINDQRSLKANAAQIVSWNKRLNERIANQIKMKKLLEQVANERRVFIENHRTKYTDMWEKIQDEIRERARILKKASRGKQRSRCTKKTKKKKDDQHVGKHSFCSRFDESFEKLLDYELCEALNTVIDIQDKVNLPFSADDPIYKAAKFIMNHILVKFDKDLSNDRKLVSILADRILKFFDEVKQFVIFRASQIIATKRDNCRAAQKCDEDKRRHTLPKFVSFGKLARTIGMSSYEVHPLIDPKPVGDRTPTPPGSLASIVIDTNDIMVEKEKAPHLCRNEVIFIEHHIIKFKRELTVGVGKRVFAAIQCHFEDKIMDVRKELLDLDRRFLVEQAASSILGYVKNPLNFESAIKLCTSAISSDIIWTLQKNLLRPKIDPRGCIRARPSRMTPIDRMKLCLCCSP